MRFCTGIAAALAAVVTSGCASIVSDSDYQTTFNSDPSGAQVTITDENGVDVQRGTTPFTTTLKASDGYFDRMDYSARYKLRCYEPATVPLKGGIDGWYWANLLVGGVVGLFIVDPATGAMYKIDPNYSVALERKPGASCTAKHAPTVPVRSALVHGR